MPDEATRRRVSVSQSKVGRDNNIYLGEEAHQKDWERETTDTDRKPENEGTAASTLPTGQKRTEVPTTEEMSSRRPGRVGVVDIVVFINSAHGCGTAAST